MSSSATTLSLSPLTLGLPHLDVRAVPSGDQLFTQLPTDALKLITASLINDPIYLFDQGVYSLFSSSKKMHSLAPDILGGAQENFFTKLPTEIFRHIVSFLYCTNPARPKVQPYLDADVRCLLTTCKSIHKLAPSLFRPVHLLALHILRGNLEGTKALIEHGLNPMELRFNKLDDFLGYFIDNLDELPKGSTVIHLAACFGQNEVLKFLLKQYPSLVNVRNEPPLNDDDTTTPLHLAEVGLVNCHSPKESSLDTVWTLLDAGADSHCLDGSKETPIDRGILFHNYHYIHKLLEYRKSVLSTMPLNDKCISIIGSYDIPDFINVDAYGEGTQLVRSIKRLDYISQQIDYDERQLKAISDRDPDLLERRRTMLTSYIAAFDCARISAGMPVLQHSDLEAIFETDLKKAQKDNKEDLAKHLSEQQKTMRYIEVLLNANANPHVTVPEERQKTTLMEYMRRPGSFIPPQVVTFLSEQSARFKAAQIEEVEE